MLVRSPSDLRVVGGNSRAPRDVRTVAEFGRASRDRLVLVSRIKFRLGVVPANHPSLTLALIVPLRRSSRITVPGRAEFNSRQTGCRGRTGSVVMRLTYIVGIASEEPSLSLRQPNVAAGVRSAYPPTVIADIVSLTLRAKKRPRPRFPRS